MLLRTSAIYGLGAVLTKALGFFLIPLYTRVLTVEEYGVLSILNVILQLVSFIFLLGISSAAMRFYFNPEADELYRKQLYGNAFLMLLIFPTLLFLLISPIAYLTATRLLPEVPFFPFIFIVVILGLFTPIVKLMAGLLRIQNRATAYVIYFVSFFLAQALIIILAVGVLGYGLVGQVYAQLITNIVFWAVAVAMIVKNSTLSFSKQTSWELLRFGFPLIPFFICAWIGEASGRFMLERYAGFREVGVLALAGQAAGLMMLMGGAFDNALVPYFYETAQKINGEKALGRFATKYYGLFGVLGLFTLVASHPIVLIMAHSSFHQAILYIPFLLLAGWLALIYKLFHWSLMHSKQTSTISLINFSSAALILILLFLFLKELKLGVYGVVFSMIVVKAFLIVVGYLATRKHFHLSFNYTDIAMSTFVILGCGAVITSLQTDSLSVVRSAVQVLVFIMAVGFMLKIAKIDDLRYFLRVRFRKQSHVKVVG